MAFRYLLIALLTVLLLAIPASIYRLKVILDPKRPKPVRNGRHGDEKPAHLLIVLGSGGHTAEMIAMLERAVNEKDERLRLDWNSYTQRTWVTGTGDTISAQRVKEFEEMATTLPAERSHKALLVTVPRARAIHQPLLTTPYSSLRCMLACFAILLPSERDFPDIILCNGPAIATILVFTSVLLRFFDVRGCHSPGKMRTVYVESWARVKKLSLSGMLLETVVDRFLVQWEQLEGGRREYLGVLV
ncbi:UDP-N-acetylglucosamine transferase subunit [Vermiconidia calcicola]|uniref:UDP-N-acetylglucosamine transferase subunit n=1 Tax=Vermiconidia calcicola TaxID=1690605 RepID=A0ACC3NC70_9PEZI|nr:UDP-N-acetylglucosamine transferase subunit [Vermiconidia calcicola]